MTSIFSFLFKYRPFLFEKGRIALHPPWPWPIILLLIAAALAGSYFLYRRGVGTLPRSWRFALAGLRAVPLLVLIAVFLQQSVAINRHPPVIVQLHRPSENRPVDIVFAFGVRIAKQEFLKLPHHVDWTSAGLLNQHR